MEPVLEQSEKQSLRNAAREEMCPFRSVGWMLSLCVCQRWEGGNPVSVNKVQLYWYYLWEVFKIELLAVNKPVNQISSEGCCSCKHRKRSTVSSLYFFSQVNYLYLLIVLVNLIPWQSLNAGIATWLLAIALEHALLPGFDLRWGDNWLFKIQAIPVCVILWNLPGSAYPLPPKTFKCPSSTQNFPFIFIQIRILSVSLIWGYILHQREECFVSWENK